MKPLNGSRVQKHFFYTITSLWVGLRFSLCACFSCVTNAWIELDVRIGCGLLCFFLSVLSVRACIDAAFLARL